MSATQQQTPVSTDDHQDVLAGFRSHAALAEAASALCKAGFDASRLTLPPSVTAVAADGRAHSEESPETEEDEQQVRTLTSSTGAAAAALAGAAVVVATGGAAAAAMAVAAGAGMAMGGVIFAVNKAEEDSAPDDDGLTLVVATHNAQELSLAQQVLRDAGARVVDIEPHAAAAIE
jgi:predicted phage tail protein